MLFAWTPQDIQVPEIHLPEFNIHVPDIHVEHMTSFALAQAEKGITVIGPGTGKGEYRIFNEPSSGEAAYSQARGYIDRNQYDRALEPLDRLINAKGDRADAAQ